MKDRMDELTQNIFFDQLPCAKMMLGTGTAKRNKACITRAFTANTGDKWCRDRQTASHD